jgi:hypothetical protein
MTFLRASGVRFRGRKRVVERHHGAGKAVQLDHHLSCQAQARASRLAPCKMETIVEGGKHSYVFEYALP